jgi:hypothetical protein
MPENKTAAGMISIPAADFYVEIESEVNSAPPAPRPARRDSRP